MLTPQQREERKQWIGSSDVAAILGLDPYRTAYEVWAEKTNKLEESEDDHVPYFLWGRYFEPAVLDWAEDQLGRLHRAVPTCRHATLPLAAHPDAFVVQTGEPVEAKTAGLGGPVTEDWGDPGTRQTPMRVQVQCEVHLMCVPDQEVCHVPAFLGDGRGFVMYHVPHGRDTAALVAETVQNFWEKHVLMDIPPDDANVSLDLLKRIRRQAGTVTQINRDVFLEWRAKDEIAKDAQAVADAAKARVLKALGTAEIGNAGDAGGVTFFRSSRTGMDSKALREAHPDIAEAFMKRISFPRLLSKTAEQMAKFLE